MEVREDGAYANLVWPAILEHRGVSDRDAAFATELAYGTLRWLGRHDAVLASCTDRPLGQLDPGLLDVLRLGVHQLHNMRVATHAAVSESVTLAAAVVHPGAAKLANAVLRRVAAGGTAQDWLEELQRQGLLPADRLSAQYLSVAWSHPEWIVNGFADALAGSAGAASDGPAHGAPAQSVGPAADGTVPRIRAGDLEAGQPDPGKLAQLSSNSLGSELVELLAADNQPARVTLAARTVLRSELLADLRGAGLVAEPGELSRLAVRLAAANPAKLPAVATGRAGVQDEGSQVVALALSDAPLEGTDSSWLDMCAGPGGKAALLAVQVAGRGGRLTAVELHAHRAELVRRSLRPLPGRHTVLCADALAADIGSGYDRVLLDAPCTGLGALRRRPESRWRRTRDDLADLVVLQDRLLRRALTLVRPGGLVLYVTCSPLEDETNELVASVLDTQTDCEVVPISGPPGTADGPYLRTWPQRHDTDGMFAALLRRSE